MADASREGRRRPLVFSPPAQAYAGLKDRFLTGDHPAVVRSRLASAAVDAPSDGDGDVHRAAENVRLHQLEAGPSHGEFGLPVDAERREDECGAALDAER